MTDILVIGDPHAHPDHPNDRADWLGQFIVDRKPDIVVNMGDACDLASLSSYDKGKRSFHGKSYQKDMESHWDFQDRMWSPVWRTKKKRPHRIILEGNHEHRVERVLDLSPELEGTLSFKNFGFDHYYQDIVRYEGGNPGIIEIQGVLFSHFFPSGVMGRPVGGERPAYSLIAKNGMSSVQSHIHTLDYATRRTVNGTRMHGLVAGCYMDYKPDWSGVLGNMWTAGLCMLNSVDQGNFDFEFISLERLKSEYAGK